MDSSIRSGHYGSSTDTAERLLPADTLARLCESSCGACDVVRGFERVNDRSLPRYYNELEKSKIRHVWASCEVLEAAALTCDFCAYLFDRYEHANLAATTTDNGGSESEIELTLVANGERISYKKGNAPVKYGTSRAPFEMYDLVVTGGGRLVVLAFERHSNPEVYVGGRCVGPYFDPAIGRTWLASCQRDHRHRYTDRLSSSASALMPQPFADSPQQKWTFRTIDATKRCIREHPEPHIKPPYVALSYVWGSAPQLMLTKARHAQLMQPEALFAEGVDLPLTIKDALSAAVSLGFEHLWVDALCIVQDDDSDREIQIANMGLIYRQAEATLVSTATSVHSGIPGVESARREDRQRSYQTANFSLINRVPGVLEMIGYCDWWSRGWTLQEYALSDCMIMYTAAQAFFMCQGGVVWYEDTISARGGDVTAAGITEYREVRASTRFLETKFRGYDHLIGSSEPATARYDELVRNYQCRRLRYHSDSLAAIEGILKTIGDSHYGLPCDFFTDALCWNAQRTHSRSDTKDKTIIEPQTTFPSWTWLAWLSPNVVLQQFPGKYHSVVPVDVFAIWATAEGEIEHRTIACAQRPGSCRYTSPCPNHRYGLNTLQQDLLASSELLQFVLTRPSLSGYCLRFRSYVAHLYVSQAPKKALVGSGALYDVSLDNAMSTILTDIRLESAWRALQHDTLSFLRIGSWRGEATLLLVQFRNGIAYRVPSVIKVEDKRIPWHPMNVTLA